MPLQRISKHCPNNLPKIAQKSPKMRKSLIYCHPALLDAATAISPPPKVRDFVGWIAAGPLPALALPSLLAKSVSLFSLHFLKEDMRRQQQVSQSVNLARVARGMLQKMICF